MVGYKNIMAISKVHLVTYIPKPSILYGTSMCMRIYVCVYISDSKSYILVGRHWNLLLFVAQFLLGNNDKGLNFFF